MHKQNSTEGAPQPIVTAAPVLAGTPHQQKLAKLAIDYSRGLITAEELEMEVTEAVARELGL
jgi:hypothetical protein